MGLNYKAINIYFILLKKELRLCYSEKNLPREIKGYIFKGGSYLSSLKADFAPLNILVYS
jgi:hypothetical protein